MQNKLNILVSELGPSQKNYYLIKNINERKEVNVNVFTENLSRFCLRANFAVMNIAEAWAQSGLFVATNLSTASKLINQPLASAKIFYIWDLEFIRGDNRLYDNYAPVYLHKELELACRSKEHAELVENAFNKKVKYIVDNFDINQLLEITNERANA